MRKKTLQVEVFASNISQTQRNEAEKKGINLSDPKNLIFLIPNQGFSKKQTNKPLSSYNNGVLRMMIEKIIAKLPSGSMVVNDNIPERIKSVKMAAKRGRKPKNMLEA